MGFNEILLLLTAVISAVFVVLAWTVDRERLHSVILIFLILISVVGAKIVVFFGHATNTGNVFYAAIFLATYFLIERYGKREGFRSILIGVVGVLFFAVFIRLAIALIGSGDTMTLDSALSVAYSPVSRLAFAALCGYIISQTVNVYAYAFLKTRYGRQSLWLRANLCNILAQLVDSLIFFTVAFAALVPPANIVDIMVTGFIIKVIFVMATTPLLYLNKVEHESDGKFSSLTLH